MKCVTLTRPQRRVIMLALRGRARISCADARRKDPKTLDGLERMRWQSATELLDLADLIWAADQMDLWIDER